MIVEESLVEYPSADNSVVQPVVTLVTIAESVSLEHDPEAHMDLSHLKR